MERRETRSKAKAVASKRSPSRATTSERSRRVKARKLNKKQQMEEQDVGEHNFEEKNEELNVEEHNVEEQHARVDFGISSARHNAHASFDTSKKPHNRVTPLERSKHVKARKLNKKKQLEEQNVDELNVEEQNMDQNVEQNIKEQNVDEHNAEEQYTRVDVGTTSARHNAEATFDNSKNPRNRVTPRRSRRVKARKLNKKQQMEQNVDELNVEEQNVEQNIEEQNMEEHNVEEQYNRNDVGIFSARHNTHASFGPNSLSTEHTFIQHEEETISTSIQREIETNSTSNQHEQETLAVEYSQQVGAKKNIEFNRHGEAVGPNATHFKAQVGKFVKILVPISFTTWQKVPKNYKDDVWNEILREFEVPSYLRNNVEKSMPAAFRRFKHNLRKYHLDKQPNLESRKLDIPPGIKKEDWEKFCINESNEKQIKIRARNIQIQKKSSYCHTGGRRSAAMIEHEMLAEGNHSVTRTDVWLAAHTRKDGTVLSSSKPLVEKVKAKLDEFKRSGGSSSAHHLSIDDDPLAQVLSKKPKGLPGVGTYVSKSKYEAALHPHKMYSHEKRERELLEKKFDKMQTQLDFIVDYCKSQLVRGSSTPMTTLVVDDGSSASTAMKEPLLGKKITLESTSGESTPNARMLQLLDWNKNCVAVAREVTDPTHKAICRDYRLKTEYEMKVSLRERKILDAKLYKETSDAKVIKDVAVGDFLVWPMSHISFLGSEK